MRIKKIFNKRIISGVIAASMVLSSIQAAVFADTDVPETEPDITIDYTVSETEETVEADVVIETSESVEESDGNVDSIPEDEDSSDEEFNEDDIEPPIEETEATEEATETVEDVAEEIEPIVETTVDIISVSNADEFISAVANLSNDNRIVVNTTVDITTSIENATGVYFDGTYVISFNDITSLDTAISYFDNANISYAVDGTVSLCGTGLTAISNAEINPNATTRVAVIDTGSNVSNEAYSVIGDSTSDGNGHGTRIVNYILDNTNDAYIISIKAIGSDGVGSVSDLCSALEFAMDSDVDVIVMALSIRNNGEYEALEQLIAEANGRGITIIASAGNNNTDASNYLPAGCSDVITVGAITEDGFKYSTSNYGACVNYYVEATSTSEAAAIFAGKFVSQNITGVTVSYLDGTAGDTITDDNDDVIPCSDTGWETMPSAGYVGSGYMTWLTQSNLSSFSSSDEVRDAIIARCENMSGSYYGQQGGPEYIDCMSFVQRVYADLLIDGYSCYWNGEKYIESLTGMNRPVCLDTTPNNSYSLDVRNGYDTVREWAGRAPHNIGWGGEPLANHGDSLTATLEYLGAQRGDIVLFGEYYIDPRTNTETNLFRWTHAAIYAGEGTWFYESCGSTNCGCVDGNGRSITGLHHRNDYPSENWVIDNNGNRVRKGYNRIAVLSFETFGEGYISVEKIVAPGYENIVSGNPCYSLNGTTYTLYSDEACTNSVQTFTFDSNGNCSTQYKVSGYNTTYYLKETSAGSGYLLDSTVYKLTLGANINSPMTVTNMTTNQSYSVNADANKVFKATVSDIPGLDPLNISLAKDNGTFDTTAPLTGARFRLDYYQTTETVSGNPFVSYEFALSDLPSYRVNSDGSVSGNVTLSFLAGLTPTRGSNYIKTVYDALRAVGISNPNHFPVGTYRITEIAAPTGYTLNNQTNQFVIYMNDNHSALGVNRSTLGSPDYRGTVTNELTDNNLKITFHETPEVGYVSLKKTLNVDEELAGRYNFTCYNTTNGTLIARGTTLADGTVSWVYVAANYRSVEVNANGAYKVLTGTTTTVLELPVYNDNHEKIVYEFRETIPTNHDYEGTGVNYTYDCPSDWNQGNGYFYKTFTVNAGTPSAKNTKIVQCPNRLMYGSLVILKTISDGEGLTEDQTFTFNIYSVDANGKTTLFKENVSVTVPAGQTSGTSEIITQVPLGTYRVVENTNPRYIESYVREEVTVTDYTVHPNPFEFSVNNQLKRFDIDFTKYTILPDGSRVEGAVGDATLEGAVYRVFRDVNGNGKFDDGEWFKDYTTDKNGQFTTDDGDEFGELIVGYTYYLYELSASEGYRVNGELLDISHAATEQDSHYARYVHEQSETVMDLNIRILKLRSIDPETVEPEEGAQFEVYLTSAGSYENAREFERALITTDANGYATTPKLPYGTYTVHQIASNYDKTNVYISDFTVTGYEDGRVYMYTKINNLIELMLQIRKVDGTLEGALIPYAGAEFEIYRINADGSETKVVERYGNASRSIFTTNDDGIIELTYPLAVGNYKLVEITAPFGYVVWDEPLEFEISRGEIDDEITVGETGNERMYGRVIVDAVNTPVMGAAVVTKIGEGFTSVTYDEATNTYIPVWENVNLSGATFNVYAAEDIVALDGTIRFHKDQLVTTITTGEDGTAATGNILYLNANGIGRYYMVETVAPVGYALDTQRYSFTVNYENQTTPIVTASVAIMDTHFIPNLEVYKNLMPGTVSGTDGEVMDAHDYTQVTFGIYAAEDITAADGEKIPKDGLIEIIRCDADGLAVSTTKYPFGSYYVRELTTDRWHYMDETEYGFEYTCPTSRTITDPVVTLGLSSVITNTPETPNIGTTFTYNNSHVAPMNSTVTLVDTVEYEGLMPHTRYEMEGYIVVVNSDGTTSLFNNGETVGVSFVTGAANNDDETVSGTIDVEFEIDTTNLAGKSLVAFETLYHEGVKIAVHMDIHDENQTIVVPNIHTTATVNGQKEFEAGADITLVDTITYENLEVGRTYRVSGILMDKSTNQSLGVGECCADVLAETTFTPTTSSGTVTVEFHFNASALANGQELVVFEEIYDVETNTKIAEHKDITDTDQTVTVRVTTTPTPTPTPPTTITQTGEAISSTFYVGTILLIAGAFGIAVMVFRKRVKVEDGNADNTER